MNWMNRTAAAGLAVALIAGGSTALAKGGKHNKAGKADHGIRGTVSAVTEKTITVETKKKGAQEFQLTDTTVYETKGKKKQGNTPAARTDVQQGAKVQIVASGTTAEKVIISAGKQKAAGKHKHHKNK